MVSRLKIIVFTVVCFTCFTANAALIDLSSWSSDGDGVWNLQSNTSVIQRFNSSQPSIFYSNTNDLGNKFSGQVSVRDSADDDFFGFVLGYNAGDSTNDSADYLLIDWKQATQSTYLRGLSISHITGALDSSTAWDHEASSYFEELQRADTLGSTGWRDFLTYNFDILFTANTVQVFINDILQLSIEGLFSNGSFGFYTFSQQNVQFSSFEQEALASATTAVPEPSTTILFVVGFMLFAFRKASFGKLQQL